VEEAWPQICEQFSQQVLLLAEQLRPAMDRLETQEDDPDRLQLLYQVDHAVTRMRRAARELRVLAGSGTEELDGHTTSLVDVVRLAESSIERYTQVTIGKVVQLAVVPYASEDVAALVVALLDNATRYSPSTVTVSAHLLDNGAVMIRIEDTGIGIAPERLRAINALLAGPVPPVTADTGRHTGFPVVHRLARKHGIGVNLACRSVGGGTIAMAVLPPALLCEIPDEVPGAAQESGPAARPGRAAEHGPAHLTMAPRAETPGLRHREEPPADLGQAGGELPRRESVSLRGTEQAPPRRAPTSASGDPAAAGLSFAADLEAFTGGERAAAAEGHAAAHDERPDPDGGGGSAAGRHGTGEPTEGRSA
jgi:hypothetical protein